MALLFVGVPYKLTFKFDDESSPSVDIVRYEEKFDFFPVRHPREGLHAAAISLNKVGGIRQSQDIIVTQSAQVEIYHIHLHKSQNSMR